jgi:hypothetical protein
MSTVWQTENSDWWMPRASPSRSFTKNSPRKSTTTGSVWTRILLERSCPSEPFADFRLTVPEPER